MRTHNPKYARSEYHTQLANMSADKTFDLTAGVYFHFFNISMECFAMRSLRVYTPVLHMTDHAAPNKSATRPEHYDHCCNYYCCPNCYYCCRERVICLEHRFKRHHLARVLILGIAVHKISGEKQRTFFFSEVLSRGGSVFEYLHSLSPLIKYDIVYHQVPAACVFVTCIRPGVFVNIILQFRITHLVNCVFLYK